MPVPPTKVFTADTYAVTDQKAAHVAIITNAIVTIVEGRTQGTTAWSITFDVKNYVQGDDNALLIDFYTAEGGPIPVPHGGVPVVQGWHNHCYYGNDSHRRSDGVINVPYEDFVGLAHSIKFRQGAVHTYPGKDC